MQSIIQLLNLRREFGGDFDGTKEFKIALVVEGGGMRGVISCAYLEALEKFGYTGCFDRIYGTSAGALNAAYFVSGQSALGTSIYCDGLSSKKFINPFRWPDPMNLDYLFDEWVCGKKPLDLDRLFSSRTKLTITATDCSTGLPAYFKSDEMNSSRLMQALRASASTPMFTTNRELIDDVEYNDGLVNDAIPLASALRDGCTHILCLLTRPKGYRKSRNKIIGLLEDFRLSNFHGSYIEAFHRRQDSYNKTISLIESQPATPCIESISPKENDFMVGNGEVKREKLLRAAKCAVATAGSWLCV